MGGIRVIKPGLQTTIQDRGRWGFQALGVPVAGPMDPCSHRTANALAGNDPDAATLEITLLGPELEFEDERLVAVSGAEFEMSVDALARPLNAAFRVAAGSRLRFGNRIRGTRAYVAIGGGIAVPPIMGSRATHVPGGLGGLEGRALIAGDRVPLGEAARVGRRAERTLPADSYSTVNALDSGHARVRVLPGPQAERFAASAFTALQADPYVISRDSDRMGYRLEGRALQHAGSAEIISDATPLGVLQVPSSGQPVLLMADRQTTGGYPKVATVISADIGIAGQLGPGDAVSFEVCTLQDAYSALIALERSLMAIEAAVAR
jgi:biotin-dependent carboxylase-like uncharacterized protein